MKKAIIGVVIGTIAAVVCKKIYQSERSIGEIIRRKPSNEPKTEHEESEAPEEGDLFEDLQGDFSEPELNPEFAEDIAQNLEDDFGRDGYQD